MEKPTLTIRRAGEGKAEARALLLTQSDSFDYAGAGFSPEETAMLRRHKDAKRPVATLLREGDTAFVQHLEQKPEKFQQLEAARRAGFSLYNELKSFRIGSVLIETDAQEPDVLLAFAEGLALSSYNFDKYKKRDENAYTGLQSILLGGDLGEADVLNLQALHEAMTLVRDFVNEPVSHLTAEQFSDEIRSAGERAGFTVEVFNKAKIEALRMGGLLAVNKGSIDPPTFNCMEWKPEGATNQKPIVLVGKGVVYDTGGLSLKPTPGSMDTMKSDMAGGAAVVGMMYWLARTNTPLHVVGIIPATDNRPGGNAVTPGDVITISDGTTVEVLNTDAEGRLILADALHYAKKFEPEVVFDFATLTGAAARAIGQYGTVYMGNATEDVKRELEECGRLAYERLVEFPLWDEYADMIKSDIADLKNVGSGQTAGAITAGKFLQHFTDYPWLHFDIAGPSFLSGTDYYRGKNASGVGLRLLITYFQRLANGKA